LLIAEVKNLTTNGAQMNTGEDSGMLIDAGEGR
jgi:hypothetical protein